MTLMTNADIWHMAWNGCITSSLATAICYPLDTIKTSLQATGKLPRIPHIRSLYRGCSPELMGNVASGTAYWSVYQTMRDCNYSPFLSSITSAAVCNIIDTPFDIYKKQRQLHITTSLHKSIVTRFSLASVCYSTVYNGIYMPLLHHLTIEKDMHRTLAIAICSTTASIATYPVDRWRTRVVAPNTTSIPWYKGLMYRILYGNIYSGLYMHILLYLTNGTL